MSVGRLFQTVRCTYSDALSYNSLETCRLADTSSLGAVSVLAVSQSQFQFQFQSQSQSQSQLRLVLTKWLVHVLVAVSAKMSQSRKICLGTVTDVYCSTITWCLVFRWVIMSEWMRVRWLHHLLVAACSVSVQRRWSIQPLTALDFRRRAHST